MIAAEMPFWERSLLQIGFAMAMTVCFAWTLLIVVVCWPFAMLWRLARGEGDSTEPDQGGA